MGTTITVKGEILAETGELIDGFPVSSVTVTFDTLYGRSQLVEFINYSHSPDSLPHHVELDESSIKAIIDAINSGEIDYMIDGEDQETASLYKDHDRSLFERAMKWMKKDTPGKPRYVVFSASF